MNEKGEQPVTNRKDELYMRSGFSSSKWSSISTHNSGDPCCEKETNLYSAVTQKSPRSSPSSSFSDPSSKTTLRASHHYFENESQLFGMNESKPNIPRFVFSFLCCSVENQNEIDRN
jgi:hypothetical protein